MNTLPTINTNAEDKALAQLLSLAKGETMLSVITRKQGIVRGRGTEKKIYNNPKVHVLIWVGWDYQGLVQLSVDYLRTLQKEGFLREDTLFHARQAGEDLSLDDVLEGIQAMRASLYKSLKEPPFQNLRKKWLEHVPLEVNGKVMRGIKVYTGPDRRTEKNPRAPVPGQMTVHGLKLGEVLLEEPPNGYYTVNSANVTIARNLVKRRLPLNRYVSYVCKPEAVIAWGQEAVRYAQQNDVKVDAAAVLALFSLSQQGGGATPVTYNNITWI